MTVEQRLEQLERKTNRLRIAVARAANTRQSNTSSAPFHYRLREGGRDRRHRRRYKLGGAPEVRAAGGVVVAGW